MFPLICLLGFGMYSIASISISLLQFSDVTNGKAELAEDILRAQANLRKRVMISRFIDYLKEIIDKGVCLIVYDLNLKIPNGIVLNDQIQITKPRRKEYGDLSTNIVIKLERWLRLAASNNELEFKDDQLNADFLSEKLISTLDSLLNSSVDKSECSRVYFYKIETDSSSVDIKFRIENRSRGFINFHIISDQENRTIEDFIITKNESELFNVRTIGYCYSCWMEKFGIPRQSVLAPSSRGVVQLLPEFNSDFIYGLIEFSHLWIVFIFNEVPENTSLNSMVRPPRLDGRPMGVYSTRSPHRVNRIGISVAKIESISGNRIYISGVDLLNCTPIIDIKPYHLCDAVDREKIICPEWVSDRIGGDFDVIIPDKILEKLRKITAKEDVLSEEEIGKYEKKLNRQKSFGGEWPFLFFRSQAEFLETVTQSLSYDVRCRQRKENEYGGTYQMRIDSFEIHYKVIEGTKSIELTNIDLILA
ncbi:VirR/VirH-like protein [Cryptosporidium canis]|uniref:VirR/VirH-like protein n=1 Tax=Cryptosporidium canis TaxID=195482 RepID=A0ABQ8P845_9CRYT|nr:VirR/VirH-like protein [Cryptosporidium canis]